MKHKEIVRGIQEKGRSFGHVNRLGGGSWQIVGAMFCTSCGQVGEEKVALIKMGDKGL